MIDSRDTQVFAIMWLVIMLPTGYYYTYGSEGYRGDPKAGKDERTYKGKKDEIPSLLNSSEYQETFHVNEERNEEIENNNDSNDPNIKQGEED